MAAKLIIGLIAIGLVLTSVDARADNFGAIAYDMDTNAYGVANDYQSQDVANQVALSSCAQNGRNCEVVVRYINSCGAYATGPDRTNGYGWGPSREQAERAAKFFCDQRADGRCRTRISGCDTFSAGTPSYTESDPMKSTDPSAGARNRAWAEDAKRWGGQQEYDRICQNSPGGCQ